jgi:hypothetical protein
MGKTKKKFIWGFSSEIQSKFGGTQRVYILILGYADTKRLRTPEIKHYLESFTCLQNNFDH